VSDNQQRILGYFIEEAREHLTTLEKGLLNLSDVIADSEEVNELFRAAHSIKGGGAMLGYSSIQKVAHRLEDSFKFLQEHSVTVDEHLESLFLNGFDALKTLVDQLEELGGLQPEAAEGLLQQAEPNFAELQTYLSSAAANTPAAAPAPTPAAAPAAPDTDIRSLLRQLLDQFKRADAPETRERLKELCDRLAAASDAGGWQNLVRVAKAACSNRKHTYRAIAPVAIAELKRGSDLLEAGRAGDIAPSETLERLATTGTPHVLLPVDPQAAADTLRRLFDPKQLDRVMQLLASSR